MDMEERNERKFMDMDERNERKDRALRLFTPKVRKMNSKQMRNYNMAYDISNKDHVYIGRTMPGLMGSKWGNKYTGNDCIPKYIAMLGNMSREQLLDYLKPLYGKYLYCWCIIDDCRDILRRDPYKFVCHGQVLAYYCANNCATE